MKGIRARLRGFIKGVLEEHTSPGKVAAAVFLGCIIGCSPFFGFHFPLSVALAWLFGLNSLIVYGAANISVPPLVALIGLGSAQLGERMLNGRWIDLGGRHLHWTRLAREFFVDWVVGGLVLGAILGAIAAAVVYALLVRRDRRREANDPIVVALRAAARRYDGAHPRLRWYARLKYRLDPCYRAIAALVPPASFTVDLGTGLGMLPLVLGLLGEERRALGVEWDPKKLACGVEAARGLPSVELVEADARGYALPLCDVITLVDVLHYYDAEAQEALLARCRDALRPGGRLLVREGDGARKGGARWTRFVERVARRMGWNRGPAVRFRPAAELRTALERLGLSVRTDGASGQLHPGNVLLIGERPPLESAAAESEEVVGQRG